MRADVGTVRKRTIFSESVSVDLTAATFVLEDELRERGQGDRPDGDAEEPEGQVHDPEGVVEPADAALGQRRDQDRVDEDVDARPGQPDRDGDEQGHDPAELRVAEAQDGAPAEALAPERRHLDEELHQPADEDADGHAEDGLLAAGDVPAVGQERDEDREEVEDGRGDGRARRTTSPC